MLIVWFRYFLAIVILYLLTVKHNNSEIHYQIGRYCEKKIIIKAMKADKKKLEKELFNIVSQLKNMGAKKLILFGSLARGQVRLASDIDLIAIFDDDRNFKERMKFVYSQLNSGEGVDILTCSFREFEKVKNRPFFKNILSYGRIIDGTRFAGRSPALA